MRRGKHCGGSVLLRCTCMRMVSYLSHRMTSRADVVLRSLLKFLLDVSSDSDLDDSLKQRLMSEATLCIMLMDCCCHGNLQVRSSDAIMIFFWCCCFNLDLQDLCLCHQSLLQQVEGSSCSSDVLRCLATVTGPIHESRASVSCQSDWGEKKGMFYSLVQKQMSH